MNELLYQFVEAYKTNRLLRWSVHLIIWGHLLGFMTAVISIVVNVQ